MPSRRYDELDVAAGQERAEQAAAPAPAAARLLALQRSAGNAAVGRLLQRKFYERTDAGAWIWHPEPPGPEFVDTGETTWSWLWSYPVFRRAPTKQQEAPAERPPKKRRKRHKPKPVVPDVPQAEEQTGPQEEAHEQEPPEIVAVTEQEQEEPEDDGGGWTDVRSKHELQLERAQNADIPALVRQVDDHRGAPTGVLETFNGLFNALHAQNQLQLGRIRSAYVSNRWDRPRGGFSVAVTIPPLQNWILHAHLEANGEPATGENATHYKRGVDEFALGASIALLPKQVERLVPDAATCLHYARNTAHLRI